MPLVCPATWSHFLTGKSLIEWTNDTLWEKSLLQSQRHFPCSSRSLVIDAPLKSLTTQTLEKKYYGRFVTFLFHFLGLTLWSSYPRLWSSFSWTRRLCLLSVSLSLGASGCSEPSRWRGKRNICYFQQNKDVIAKVISKPLLTVIRRNVNPCLQNICSSGKNLSGSWLIAPFKYFPRTSDTGARWETW